MPPAPSRTIVVGASSGIGAALVEALAARGDPVIGLARRGDLLAGVARRVKERHPAAAVGTIEHDVRNLDAVPGAFDQAVGTLGGLDRIIYAAGVMPGVGPDEFSIEKDRDMVAVNVTGAMAWLDLAARRFQAERKGQIVGISSVAGDRGRRPYPGYAATKAALTCFLESLRNRLSRHGVSVVTVKPGFIGTDMLKNAAKVFWVITPEDCARRILAGADARRQSFYVPARWGLVSFVIRNIPSFVFRRLDV
jgi:short-subunit dehydrogenase